MPSRLPLTFLNGDQRFNYRVAAICQRGEHVLVCREDDDPYVLLPGGRVEFGEPSGTALAREMREELGVVVDRGALVFSAESFFDRDGERFHEIGLYYRVDLPSDFPFAPGEAVLAREDEGHLLQFSWVPVEPGALTDIHLQPRFLRGSLSALPEETVHIQVDEREQGEEVHVEAGARG